MSFLRKGDQNGHIQADFRTCFVGVVRKKLAFCDFLFDKLLFMDYNSHEFELYFNFRRAG